jgi:hypothetical protein
MRIDDIADIQQDKAKAVPRHAEKAIGGEELLKNYCAWRKFSKIWGKHIWTFHMLLSINSVKHYLCYGTYFIDMLYSAAEDIHITLFQIGMIVSRCGS